MTKKTKIISVAKTSIQSLESMLSTKISLAVSIQSGLGQDHSDHCAAVSFERFWPGEWSPADLFAIVSYVRVGGRICQVGALFQSGHTSRVQASQSQAVADSSS